MNRLDNDDVAYEDHAGGLIYEPRHDKTNKMGVRQAKTQISPGIRPVRSESRCALNR